MTFILLDASAGATLVGLLVWNRFGPYLFGAYWIDTRVLGRIPFTTKRSAVRYLHTSGDPYLRCASSKIGFTPGKLTRRTPR